MGDDSWVTETPEKQERSCLRDKSTVLALRPYGLPEWCTCSKLVIKTQSHHSI